MTKNSVRSKKPVPAPATVYVAPCNRLPTTTVACWADRLRVRFETKVRDALETAQVRLNQFKDKFERDEFSAFDWDGKGAVEAAGRKRAAMEVQSMLTRHVNDGYIGGDNLRLLQRVNYEIVTQVVDKARFNTQIDEKETARLKGCAELQGELRFGLEYFELDAGLIRTSTCAVQDYDGYSLLQVPAWKTARAIDC